MSILPTTRVIRIITIIVDVLLIALIINSFFLYYNIKEERKAQAGRIEMLSAGNLLIKTSDMLTSEARSFAVTSDLQHFKRYWEEVSALKNRDAAVDILKRLSANEEEINLLIQSKRNSDKLIKTELRSMRLMLESYQVPESIMPSVVKNFRLSSLDASLRSDQKILLAQKILFDHDYAEAKKQIFLPIAEFEKKLMKRTIEEESEAKKKTDRNLLIMTMLCWILAILVVSATWHKTSQKFKTKKRESGDSRLHKH